MTKYIPDCYWPEQDNGAYVSHESICALNTSASPATVRLTFYFEDRPKMEGFCVTIPAERTLHIRLDKLKNANGEALLRGIPYAAMIESDVELALQYTRLDATQPELALMTTML